jgi:hypothetical protein
MKFLSFALIFILPLGLFAQKDTSKSKLSFTGDFRFRVEEDWNSRKSDGSYRDDRTRLRYRFRFGMSYQYNNWASFGMRIRTGIRNHQQDPQITFGTNPGEFGTIPLGFEKLYFKADYKWLSAWVGKYFFPFEQQNELFWSDNVFPEGVFFSAKFQYNSAFLQSLKLGAGHFIVNNQNASLDKDRYFEGIQLITTHWKSRLKVFPTFYYFNKMSNIPDGQGTYDINYSILQIGTKIQILDKPNLTFGVDYYYNFSDYNKNDSIPQDLKNQKQGLVIGLELGKFEEKKDWTIRVYYSYLERYSAVDFLAQNDWARWDYTDQDSPAGRVTNFQGIEILAGYVIGKNFKINVRYFLVEQLIPYGIALETGSRIRLDLDIGF